MALRGIFQILHTPFEENGDIDFQSIDRQVEFCLKVGVHGLVMPANASEFFALSDDERFEVVERAIDVVSGQVPVVVGVQAPTARAAVRFAEHAASRKADAVMAMPPYLRSASRPVLFDYYRSIAAVGLDVIIQNAPAPIGTPQATPVLAELMASERNIAYLKEEVPPILHRISAAVKASGDHCKGIFGGANGLVIVEELDRGGCGNMPAGGVVDVQVKIYDTYVAGDRSAAIEMQSRVFPLLFHAATYGVTFHKHLLWRRGIIKTPIARDPQAIALDAEDIRTIEERFSDIADLMDESATLSVGSGS